MMTRAKNTGDASPGAARTAAARAAAGLMLVGLQVFGQEAFAQSEMRFEHTLPLVMSASNTVQQGFVRIINHSNQAGTVQIHATDDSGRRFGPVSFDVAAKASVHFNSDDLESGNVDKDLVRRSRGRRRRLAARAEDHTGH